MATAISTPTIQRTASDIGFLPQTERQTRTPIARATTVRIASMIEHGPHELEPGAVADAGDGEASHDHGGRRRRRG